MHLAAEVLVAQSVEDLARVLWRMDWKAFTIQEGSKGSFEVETATLRAVMADDGPQGREEWLALRRPVGETEPRHWICFRSNAPPETPCQTLARLTPWR